MTRLILLLAVVVAICQPAEADEPDAAPAPDAVRAAAERGLVVVQKAARSYPSHRQCFACHHQTLPLLAMTAARDAGVEIDAELLASQVEFTRASFRERIESLKAGSGIGGRAMTVGYGLWTLEIAAAEPDELSAAMATYLLKTQGDDGLWRPPSNRPPMEESAVMCTVLAAYRLNLYAGDEQRSEAAAAIERAKAALASPDAAPRSLEDHNARLWGLHLMGGTDDQRQAARGAILDLQRDDGGWGQLKEMPSDAYATGQTLFVLHETGEPPDAPAFRRGVAFLVGTQKDDGSWHVETRSKPVQVYFDNGDPHGKDQFISIPATAWAVAALASSLER